MFIYGWIYLDLKYQGEEGEEGGGERVMIFTIFMFHLSLTNV